MPSLAFISWSVWQECQRMWLDPIPISLLNDIYGYLRNSLDMFMCGGCLNSTVCLHRCPPKGVQGDSLRRQALRKPVVVRFLAPQLRIKLRFIAPGIDKYTFAIHITYVLLYTYTYIAYAYCTCLHSIIHSVHSINVIYLRSLKMCLKSHDHTTLKHLYL